MRAVQTDGSRSAAAYATQLKTRISGPSSIASFIFPLVRFAAPGGLRLLGAGACEPKRLSGESYITHPLARRRSGVVEWRMDTKHHGGPAPRCRPETGATKRELTGLFGREVAQLVDGLQTGQDGVRLVSRGPGRKFPQDADGHGAGLARCVLIKLADRQHNPGHHMAAVRPTSSAGSPRNLEFTPIALRLGFEQTLPGAPG